MKPKTIIQLINENPITSKFGWRVHPLRKIKEFHNGVDIAVPTGTPISSHTELECLITWEDEVGGLQTKVTDGKYIYGLAHLSRCNVHKGDIIRKGEVFAVTGNTGRSTGPHLHLTLREKESNSLLDPLKYLKRILIFILIFLLTNCSAEWHIRRAIIKKNPQFVLDEITTKYPEFIKTQKELLYDTIIIKDTLIDTLKALKTIDSIVINKENKIIKVYRIYDTIRIKYIGKNDTIIRIREVPKFITKEEEKSKKILNIFLVILIIFVILSITYKIWVRRL
ncbi:MAG: M23 family metallopeptidase [Candidatus Anstonellales archaeon]